MLIFRQMANNFQFVAFPSVFLELQPGCITFALLLYQPYGIMCGLRAVCL